jgi:hypothetical protein
MKRLFASILFITASFVYSVDLAVMSYLPSLHGKVVGADVTWNRFKEREEVKAMSIPVEVKCVVAPLGSLVLSAIAGYTFYVEDEYEGFASHNISLGCGFSTSQDITMQGVATGQKTGLVGFFVSVYPLYEYPVATYGKDPIAPWKTALDVGFGTSIGAEGSPHIYINMYARMVGAFMEKDGGTAFRLNWPDFGIALGFHILPN